MAVTQRPPAQAPRDKPSMKTEITTDSTGVMMPKAAKAKRVQTTWNSSPQNPEMKKRRNKSGRWKVLLRGLRLRSDAPNIKSEGISASERRKGGNKWTSPLNTGMWFVNGNVLKSFIAGVS